MSDDGVRVRTGATEARMGWEELLPPERTGRLWLLPMVHAMGAVMIPARAIAGPEEEFTAYVRDRFAAVKSGSVPE